MLAANYLSIPLGFYMVIIGFILTCKFKIPKWYALLGFTFFGLIIIIIIGTSKKTSRITNGNKHINRNNHNNSMSYNANSGTNGNATYGNATYGNVSNGNATYGNATYGNATNGAFGNQGYTASEYDNMTNYNDENNPFEAKSYGKLNECESHDGGYETFDSSYAPYDFEQPRSYVLNGEVVHHGSNCHHCGAPLPAGATYCETCGSRA